MRTVANHIAQTTHTAYGLGFICARVAPSSRSFGFTRAYRVFAEPAPATLFCRGAAHSLIHDSLLTQRCACLRRLYTW